MKNWNLNLNIPDPKDPTHQYLHGMLYGLDSPRVCPFCGPVLSAEVDSTTYHALVREIDENKNYTGKDIERFKTQEPEEALAFFKKYNK